MHKVLGAVVGCVVAAGVASAQEPPVPALEVKTFDRWLEYLRPAPAEQRWSNVEWRPELWTALREATAASKPVLVWAMNGHPMACT